MSATDRRSRRPRSLRGLALWSRHSTRAETFARLETHLLGPGGAPKCRLRSDLLGYFRPDAGLSVGSNHSSHRLKGLDPEHGAHLRVARLVPPDARDRPQLLEEAGAVTVDGQGELARKRTRPAVHAVAVPLDLTVPTGDDGEPFGVGPDPEPIWLGQRAELLSGALLLRELSPTWSRDPRIASHAPGDQRRACQDHGPRYAVSQVPSDKVLCSAKGRSAPLPSARESAVFRSAPLQSTAVRFRRRPRRRRSGRSLVGPIHA